MATLSSLGAFPTETLYLHQVQARAEELAADGFAGAKKLKEAMGLECDKDPRTSKERLATLQVSEELDAHYVDLGVGRKYLLSACPKTTEKAALLFDSALDRGVSIFVSLLKSEEGKCSSFWKQGVVQTLPLRNNWKIQNVSSRVLFPGKAEVIESQLDATNGIETRKLTHLHYNGWEDGEVAPSDEQLQGLLERIERLQEERGLATPIQINCLHGSGRTGVVAVLHAIRRRIISEREQGKPLSDIRVNVLETVYAFRCQRKRGMLKRPAQLASVYRLTAAFYNKLK